MRTSEYLSISVVICTYQDNRYPDLSKAVKSVQAQDITPLEIIVVVDHNPALLERIRTDMPQVSAIENRYPRGLSGARNTGVAAARGEAIAFLDDDAIATQDWLEKLLKHLADSRVMGAGGRVEPMWETGRPAWFPEEFFWVVGCTYLGLPEQEAPVRNLFGGCMCMRREVFEAVGGFRDGIGRTETSPMGCEETELCIRATQHWPQRLFLFEPLAWAYHFVPAERTTFRYFRSRCFAEGLSKAQVARLVGRQAGLETERSYTFRTLPMGVWKGLMDAVQGDAYGLARAGAIVAGLAVTAAGYLAGLVKGGRETWRVRLDPRPAPAPVAIIPHIPAQVPEGGERG